MGEGRTIRPSRKSLRDASCFSKSMAAAGMKLVGQSAWIKASSNQCRCLTSEYKFSKFCNNN